MKILFLCTAHNSLSQRLYLALEDEHHITIEYALSSETMLSAASLSRPDLIICPFLTTLVPKEIYENYLTLIVHPGPPGDAGPSSLDWVLMGDDGSVADSDEALKHLDENPLLPGRTHWGVTVLQAIDKFDAGPVWAFDQFSIDIDESGLTKSSLYRGPITRCAVNATLTALTRIQALGPCSPKLHASPAYRELSIGSGTSFQGGILHHRPLLKATQRGFDVTRHTAEQISRRIRCSDSQPGALSKAFGSPLYIYGGMIEDSISQDNAVSLANCKIIGCRNSAVCVATCDNKGVWVTHVRRPKTKSDAVLYPKVPAVASLLEMGVLTDHQLRLLDTPNPTGWFPSPVSTLQEIWVDIQLDSNSKYIAYLHFDFYNGAMTTDHCSRLIDAMDYILEHSNTTRCVDAVVLMGGQYFSNGIALNVIEASEDPSLESWRSINRINDVVHHLLYEFPAHNIATIAAIRGNAAAGGVALATACDLVIAGANVVLNPAYRATGLSGSEYHTLSYYGRCGQDRAEKILREMMPMSPSKAQSVGLVDHVLPGTGCALDESIRDCVSDLVKPDHRLIGLWKTSVDHSRVALARAREFELHGMALDFWSARSVRYHSRRFNFIRKVKPAQTPLRFAKHRRNGAWDEEESDLFDDVSYYRKLAEQKVYENIKAMLSDAADIPSNKPDPSANHQPMSKTTFSCYYDPPTSLPPTPPNSPPKPCGLVAAADVVA